MVIFIEIEETFVNRKEKIFRYAGSIYRLPWSISIQGGSVPWRTVGRAHQFLGHPVRKGRGK